MKQRSTSQNCISPQHRLPLSLGRGRISGQGFWSVRGCVWKYSTVWEESRAIWQVLNLLAPTKEMLASGIHHSSHTQTHTRTLLLSTICFLDGCWMYWCVILNGFGVTSTNTDLKGHMCTTDTSTVNELSHRKSYIFVWPEVISKKAILHCQNHLPSHPHFLPWVSLSSALSHSYFLLCSILYTPRWHLTFVGPPVPLALRCGLSNRQINKQIELTHSQLGRVSQL